MSESMVRLILYLNHLKQHPTTNATRTLLIPAHTGNAMINTTLSLLGVFTHKHLRVHRYRRDRTYHVATLEWVDWDNDPSVESSPRTVADQYNHTRIQWQPWPSFDAPRPPTHVYYTPSFGVQLAARRLLAMVDRAVPTTGTVPTGATTGAPPPLVLWASRRLAKTRHVVNEQTVWGELARLGHRVHVHDGTGSLSDQIRWFNNAQIVVGPHGAGMTLIMFSKPTTAVMMFPLASEVVHHDGYYHHVASSVGIQHFVALPLFALNRNKNVTFNRTHVDGIVGFVEQHFNTSGGNGWQKEL